jgi:hypothetical protein
MGIGGMGVGAGGVGAGGVGARGVGIVATAQQMLYRLLIKMGQEAKCR